MEVSQTLACTLARPPVVDQSEEDDEEIVDDDVRYRIIVQEIMRDDELRSITGVGHV